MPVDPGAVGAELPEVSFTWDEDEVILYHLGIGAGSDPTDPAELEYAYEANLKVLPTFGVLGIMPILPQLGLVDGLEPDLVTLLHGEHEIELSGPLPVRGETTQRGRVTGIYDKGSGALVVLEITSFDKSGEPLIINRPSIFLRGEGGFGGESGPPAGPEAPSREPDLVVSRRTLPQQALLYRLSGDRNPLHADPAFAAVAGFDRPILHGLATYGIVCKAVLDGMLAGDVARLKRYRARFSGAVFPGETISTSVWDEEGTLLVSAKTEERGEPVLSYGVIETG